VILVEILKNIHQQKFVMQLQTIMQKVDATGLIGYYRKRIKNGFGKRAIMEKKYLAKIFVMLK
jgi:hypothetical protein